MIEPKPTKTAVVEAVKVNAPPQPPDDLAATLVVEEYKRLCGEIDLYLKESSNCINYSVAATAAVWTWLAANSDWQGDKIILFIPAILTLFWFFRWKSIQSSMGEIGKYVKATELLYFPKARPAAPADSKPHGWETYLGTAEPYPLRHQGRWAARYFLTLVVANLLIAWAVHDHTATNKNDALTKAIVRLGKAITTDKATNGHSVGVGQTSQGGAPAPTTPTPAPTR